MRQGLLGGHIAQLVAGTAAERSAAGRQHQAPHLSGRARAEALCESRVLRVHRHYLPRPRALRDERSAGDQ